jgi:poly(A) polymerase
MFKRIGVPPPLETLLAEQDRKSPVWIVGGAIRDQLLQRSTHDVDFTTSSDAIALARLAADRLNADIYILDAERGAARVLFRASDRERRTFDFAQIRGETIEADLRGRDFTINAMALRISAQDQIIDPCGGLQDVREGVLDLCAADAIDQDPIRALRAVRIATDLSFRLSARSIEAIRKNRSLASVSTERIRDEIFTMLSLDDPSPAVHLLDHLDVLQQVFLTSHSHIFARKKAVESSQAIDFALRSMRQLVSILDVLAIEIHLNAAAQATLGLLTWSLGRFRNPLTQYLFEEISFNRRRRELLLLVSFLHRLEQVPVDQHNTKDSKISSRDADRVFEELGAHFRLSRDEIVWSHQWLEALNLIDQQVDRAINTDLFSYRFFRESQTSGVGATLSFLAYELSKQVEPPAADQWAARVELARCLLEAWFEKFDTVVQPKVLISGEDVLQVLDTRPGPEIGMLLEQVREGQVLGELTTRDQALEYIKSQLKS